MSFRMRLSLVMTVAVLVPLLAFAWGIRREMERRLVAQSEQRAASMAALIAADLQRETQRIGARLASLASTWVQDPRLRQALRGDASRRPELLDAAGRAMGLSGLSMLQIQDESGRILSSGHFRNEYDRLEPELPRRLASLPDGTALVQARTPAGPLLALARVDSFRIGTRRYTLVGGMAVQESFLREQRPADMRVCLLQAAGDLLWQDVEAPFDSSASQRQVAELVLPLVTTGVAAPQPSPVRLVVTQSQDELAAAKRALDRWLAVVAGATLLLALLVATFLAARMGRPLTELAQKTSLVDLQRLDVDFHSQRSDEIGSLSRLLQSMTERLRTSARNLRAAERHAAVGDLARQVNHDIKNGLVPIRNVLAHLAQVAEQQPEQLAAVLRERRATLDSGIQYLENLAANYARLTPPLQAQACDVNAAVTEVTREAGAEGIAVQLQLQPRLPAARCDPVALRRMLENLVSNALDSFEGGRGTVTLTTAATTLGVRITVADTGRGMSASEVEQAFCDFHTTKPHGTGLGLSIVRRLVRDAGGEVHVESSPGRGSRFSIELPAGGDAPAHTQGGPERGESP